jgi:hypothetical protein
MPIKFFIALLSIFLWACKSQEVAPAAPAMEVKVPVWVSSRPNNGFKYVGIGFAEKQRSPSYQMEAKKNALYDLASEIKVNISSNSVLYTVQNSNSFNENFNSLIKLSNSDNIEGYTLVDSYENDKQYWVYYQLDKEEYAKQKALKKQQTINKASNFIASSFYDEKNQDFSSALKKRIQAFGVLTPYLSEEINFDPTQTEGIKNVLDLTNLIQNQLQSITVVQTKTVPELKPYQAVYDPLKFKLQIKNKLPLQNFPLSVHSEEDRVEVAEATSTDQQGEMQLKVQSVEPLNQNVTFALSPDISTLMGSDSVGRAGISLLKQFIQTPALKVQANVTQVTIFIEASEKNFGKSTGVSSIEMFIKQKFEGQEVRLVDKAEQADYIITAKAETQKDISSSVLEKSYGLSLAQLIVDLQLKKRSNSDLLFKQQVTEIYGYANNPEKAGLNAYASPKLQGKLSEALFFLKRKILVY